jgi:hypothetical protein
LTGYRSRRNVVAVRRRQQISSHLTRWGFAVMVATAGLIGIGVGITVALPTDIPAIALQAAPVYRLEVGSVIFICLYVAATAFVLALQNRAFIEFGSGSVKAQTLRDVPASLLKQERAMKVLREIIRDMGDPSDDREGR